MEAERERFGDKRATRPPNTIRRRNVILGDPRANYVTVTSTGTVAGSRTHKSKAQEKAEEKKEGQVEKASSKEEFADLSVTSLQMVSQTCSK
jgi:hypothetical protein